MKREQEISKEESKLLRTGQQIVEEMVVETERQKYLTDLVIRDFNVRVRKVAARYKLPGNANVVEILEDRLIWTDENSDEGEHSTKD